MGKLTKVKGEPCEVCGYPRNKKANDKGYYRCSRCFHHKRPKANQSGKKIQKLTKIKGEPCEVCGFPRNHKNNGYYACSKCKRKRDLEINPNIVKQQYQRQKILHPNRLKDDYKKAMERNPNHNKEIYRSRVARIPEINRIDALRKKYDLTLEEYEQILQAQSGVCAICKQHETRIRHKKVIALSVDHNHATGMVRELLCFRCNLLVSHLENGRTIKKYPEQLVKAAQAYIVKHNQVTGVTA